MHTFTSASPSRVSLLAGAVLFAFAPAWAGAAEEADAFPVFESYIRVTGRAPDVSGSDTAYQTGTREYHNGAVGVEALHIYKDVSRTSAYEIDGRALFGAEDYLAHFNYLTADVGSVDVGYKRFRTFYDGIGGFFPLNNLWLPLENRDLHVDRGRFWAEFKLNLPDMPKFTLRYSNETRTGTKDSTSWAASSLTGLSGSAATRKLLPTRLRFNERKEELEGQVDLFIGTTAVKLTLTGTQVDNDDVKSWVANLGQSSERPDYQNDQLKADTFAAVLTTRTPLGERVTLNTGWSYQNVESSVGGTRTGDAFSAHPHNVYDLAGGSDSDRYTVNASLDFRPSPAWYLQGAVRYEDRDITSSSLYTEKHGLTDVPTVTGSSWNDTITTPELNVRFMGIPDVVIYGTARVRMNRSDHMVIEEFDASSSSIPAPDEVFLDDIDQDQAQYLLGANWNQSSMFTLRGEVFVKDHQNDFTAVGYYVGEYFKQDYSYVGIKGTAIIRPIPQLSLTTRYVGKRGEIDLTTDRTSTWNSGSIRTYLIGQTIDWNPVEQLYFQGNIDVGYDQISTAYPNAGTPPTIAPQRNSDNNYVTGSVVMGVVLTPKTDLEVVYSHLHSHNYEPILALGTMPYGADYREDEATLGFKHLFSENLIGYAKVGYVERKSDLTGGNTNYRAPMAYLSLEYGL